MKKIIDALVLKDTWDFAIEEEDFFESEDLVEIEMKCKIGYGYENENVYSI